MNILRILTLNKHGDFEEVLFSSALSYLLDPKQDHGLGSKFLEILTREVFPGISQAHLDSAEVESEKVLDDKGSIDLLITLGDKVLAIEVKIWDRSARNISRNNEHQVERYCKYLGKEFKGRDWQFIFLIPTSASPRCIQEFKMVCAGEFRENVKLMTWNTGDPIDGGQDILEDNIIEKSIEMMLSELMNDIPRVKLSLNTQWLIDSLIDIIPEIAEKIPERGRFPNKDSLMHLPTWSIFNVFLNVGRRWPISLHSTVGIPFGFGNQRSELHGNSLYRIRTVTDYYIDSKEREKHLPTEKVEIEYWPDVYEECKEEIHAWLKGVGSDESAIRKDYHLDSAKKEPAVVLSLGKDIHVDEEQVNHMNQILKEGFRKVIQAESK